MHTQPDRIKRLVLDQLAGGEKRLLVLLVAVRRSLNSTTPFKGDLSEAVGSALRKLVASRTVIETGGVYSLQTTESAVGARA
jgi:hypothetical protein